MLFLIGIIALLPTKRNIKGESMKITNIISANFKTMLLYLKDYGIKSTVFKIKDYIEFTIKYNHNFHSTLLSETELEYQRQYNFSYNPLISLVIPLYRTPEDFLCQMLDSITIQTYTNWEICLADGSMLGSRSYISDIIHKYQKNYPNIHYTILPENLGISGNTNAALKLASGAYIGLVDHDDILAPNALFEIVKTLNDDPDIDVLYSDEDKTDLSLSSFYAPYYKPDFNLDLLRSCNYITHFYLVKRNLATIVGGFSQECNGSQDYDFILKTCDIAKNICHIPKILYHWRIHPNSVAGNPNSKSYAYDSAIKALDTHLLRCHQHGNVTKGKSFGYYKIIYPCPDSSKINVYLENCSPCVKNEIKNSYPHYNINFITNLKDTSGEYLLILSNIHKLPDTEWLPEMLSNCSRSNIGIVSGRTLYKKNKVLEYGLIFTNDGHLHSPFYGYSTTDTGYCFRANVQQNVSYVSPFFIITKVATFEKMYPFTLNGSVSEKFFYYCSNLRKKGYTITLLPDFSAIANKTTLTFPLLKDCIGKCDPYYNPNFSQKNFYHLS